MFSLLSYGEVLVDFLPSDSNNGSYIPLAGGAPANVAVAFAKLGGQSYFAGGVSRDTFGKQLSEELEHYHVDTSYIARFDDANTAIVLVSLDSDGERHFNFYRHHTADTRYAQQHIDKINWQTVGIFHFCSNTLTTEEMCKHTEYAIQKAKANKVCISFDVNLRQQLWQEQSQLATRVDACLRLADIVKLSYDEALYLARQHHLDVAEYGQYLLAAGASLVVLTNGPSSVRLYSKTFTIEVPVPHIQAVDTTAAGDGFIAGFLYYLSAHLPSQQALLEHSEQTSQIMTQAAAFAARCGAHTCLKKGAFAALPSLDDVQSQRLTK